MSSVPLEGFSGWRTCYLRRQFSEASVPMLWVDGLAGLVNARARLAWTRVSRTEELTEGSSSAWNNELR